MNDIFQYALIQRHFNIGITIIVFYFNDLIATAKVIEADQAEGVIGLFDKVELLYEEDGETETVQVVTTVRCDPLKGLISKESPLGRVLLDSFLL